MHLRFAAVVTASCGKRTPIFAPAIGPTHTGMAYKGKIRSAGNRNASRCCKRRMMENIITLIALNAIFAFFFVRGALRSAVGFFRLVLGVAALVGIAAVAVAVQRATGEDFSPVAALAAFGVIASAVTMTIATIKFLTAFVAAAVSTVHGRRATALRNAASKAAETESWSSFPAWCREEAAKHEAAEEAAAAWLYAE